MSVIAAVVGSKSRQELQLRGEQMLRRGYVLDGGAPVEKPLDRAFLGYRPYGFDGGRRSQLFHDPRSGGAVVLDGVIDNRKDLAAALGGKSAGPVVNDDARWVFEAYRRWGRHCPSRLVGHFAFALWDPEERGLLCARDPFGVRSLYYSQDGLRFTAASQLRQLLEGAPSSLDEEFLADYLAWGFPVRPPTPFPGIHRLEAGHSLWFDGQRPTITRFWDPRELTPFSHHDERRYQSEFRELFRRALGCALERETDIFCDLSGGLDSSAITCTLGELLAQRPEKQRGHTMTFVFQREKNTDEEAWLQEIQERYTLVGHRIVVDDILMSDIWEGAGYWDEPSIEIFSYSIFRSYAEAVRSTGATAVLKGNGAEAVVTSERSVPVHLADLLASFRLPSFFRQLWLWRRGLQVPLLNLLIQAVVLPFFSNRYALLESKPYEVPEWISPEFAARTELQRRATGCWGDLRCRSRYRRRRLERLYRVSGFLTRGYLEQAVLLRYPFLHQPLVEFALRVPHEYKADPIESRKLLRHGMADILPEGLRRRLRQPTGNSPLYYALERQWSSFEPALRDPVLADLGIIDRSGFEKAMKLARIGHSTNTVIMLSTLALEIWARRIFGVETGKARIA